MPARTRIRLDPLPLGGFGRVTFQGVQSAYTETTPAQSTTYPVMLRRCEDVVNSRKTDNPLDIRHEYRIIEPLNGFLVAGSFTRQFKEHIPGITKIAIGTNASISLQLPSVGTVATAALARSNPSKPAISMPNFLYELKDLPGMIRDIGNLKRQLNNVVVKGPQRVNAKNSANHFLAYQMGWRPLINDLKKLLTFQADVDKKIRELENLYNNGGLQRKVRSPGWVASGEDIIFSNTPMESVITTDIRCRVTRFTTAERWATVRWYPRYRPDHRYSSKELARLARRLVFGVNGISAKQVWDAIPWTWLIGWFSNVDEYLQAHSNTIPLIHSRPCVMTHTKSTYSWTRLDSTSWCTGGNAVGGVETKVRTTSSGTLSAAIPFLNGRQISILGALAIQRKR
ncbi:MAG: putative maturation protein [Alehxovirus frumentivicinum]|uniref:Maturation protein n=1 Tax=Leviviridae sp. TaxID=2027243 RepID=A0ABY3SSB7_9VIRU|nr:MAG: putative maturation protein [Leviviridae sp.]